MPWVARAISCPMTDERQSPGSGGEKPHGREPASRRGRRGLATRRMHPDRPCLNCGDPTPGEYCPRCGQRKVDVQVSVRALLMDVLEDQFILGRRLPRTLKALLFHPGVLTTEHLNGRIVRYIAPFRLYLASSILFFLLLSLTGLQIIERADFGAPRVRGAARDSAALIRLDSLLADTTLSEGLRAPLTIGRDTVLSRLARADSIAITRRTENWAANAKVSTPFPQVDTILRERLLTLGSMQPEEAARTVAREFLGYVPTVMFILLPIFGLVLKLLYIRRRRYYAEHFVFLLHTHAFVFAIFSVLLILRELEWLNGWLVTGLLGWTVAYIYLALKRVYGQGWLKTFVKYWVLGWTYFWILTFTIPVAVVATLLLL